MFVMRSVRSLLSLVLVLASVQVPAAFASGDAVLVPKEQRKAAPKLSLPDLDGQKRQLSQLKGQVVVVNFWATWCGPCKTEIPAFNELYTQYKDQGFVVLGVSTDDEPEQLREYAAAMKMNYPVLVGRDKEEILDAWGPIYAIPTSFYVGRDGSICGKHMGPATKEEFEREIKALL